MRRWFGARSIRRRFAVQYREQQNGTTGAGDRASKGAYMAVIRAEDIYEQHIKLLPATERLRLLAIVAQALAEHSLESAEQPPRRQWREIRGMASYPLLGEDAQAWISRTRQEGDEKREQQWEQKP
jgi:hypothetical protein